MKKLHDIARARSGDKGAHANIGVIANDAESYALIEAFLTPERVKEHFADRNITHVERYTLPNLNAFNFVLYNALENTLRIDAQGKALGQQLLLIPITTNAGAAK